MSIRKLPSIEKLKNLYLIEKLSCKEICRMYGLSPNSSSNLARMLKKENIVIRKDAGENHHNWKGGKITKGDNYIGIWKPNHKKADKQGYVYEHTLQIEKNMGRLPNKQEVIHHIDLDKHNNNEKNLYLCSRKKHTECHRGIERLIKPLMEKGIVEFKNGEYILKN